MTGPAPAHPPISSCAVVVPARNEEQLLGRCLAALEVSRRHAVARFPTVSVRTVVVLDACRDGSAGVARAAGVTVLSTVLRSVGAARHLGCEWVLSSLHQPAATCWLASTDADSAVPPDWLTTQLQLADAGADLVLGTVVPDLDEATGLPFDRWLVDYPRQDGHPHVHGANLGVRGDMYQLAGGFAAITEHEDVGLTDAIRRHGGRVVATAASPVLTSGRRTGRTPGGFAHWMAGRLEPT